MRLQVPSLAVFGAFFALQFVKVYVIGKCGNGAKDLLPIRCKQQTLSPVAVKISGTTRMCFFVSKNKSNGRSDVKRKFAEKRTHGKGVCKYRSKRCLKRFLLCGWCKAVTLPHVSQTKNVIFQISRKIFKKIGKNYLKSVDKHLKGGIMLAVEDVEC